MKRIITVPFTADFIETLADHLDRHYVQADQDLTRLAVVFGGKRPALFLKRALARRINKPFLPPKIMSIDEFIGEITHARNERRLHDLEHCFVIYQLVERHAPQLLAGREGFVAFLPWAREILHFIEQLDLEMAPPDTLDMLKAHAQLGFNVPQDINRLLEALMVLRVKYHAHMQLHQVTSRGYQYLNATGMVGKDAFDAYDQVLFCNFFYLHRSETAIIKDLYDRDKAGLILQGDERKWPALKRIGRTFGQSITEGETIAERHFALKVYGAYDGHVQAAIAAGIIKSIPSPEKTVVVLPNADALLPLLSALGDDAGTFNIALGYPLKRSSLFTLIEALVQVMHTMKDQLYYTRDYLRLLRHPLIRNLAFKAAQDTVARQIDDFQAALEGKLPSDIAGQIYISKQDIGHFGLGDIHKAIVAPWQNVTHLKDLAAVLYQWSDVLLKEGVLGQYPLNDHVLLRLNEILREWEDAALPPEVFCRQDLFKIMLERLSGELIAFSGSPLKGLQVLGLLETRSLSFEHVIVLDVNEGVLPNLNVYEPLIPREVMIKLSLDRLELEEEIQAYQFMRLISSAAHVHLIYQDRPDKSRSRFLEELIWEKEQEKHQVKAVDIIRPVFGGRLEARAKEIKKTPEMVEFLKQMTFSATSINAYLQNPYLFYQQYVLGLRPAQDMLEDPQGRQVGTLIHAVMEDVFKPFIGKKPVLDHEFKKHVMHVFELKFHDYFGKGLRSDAFLTKAVIENRLQRFLDVEEKRIAAEVAHILFIERKFNDVLTLDGQPVRFSFRMDRVDMCNDGSVLVLDYKTGAGDSLGPALSMAGAFSRQWLRDKLKSFQMPLYLYYLDKQYPNQPVNAGIYHIRTAAIEKFITDRTPAPRRELVAGYLKALSFVMTEIFNPEIPFIDDPVDIE